MNVFLSASVKNPALFHLEMDAGICEELSVKVLKTA
jgi:hypothetical protein